MRNEKIKNERSYEEELRSFKSEMRDNLLVFAFLIAALILFCLIVLIFVIKMHNPKVEYLEGLTLSQLDGRLNAIYEKVSSLAPVTTAEKSSSFLSDTVFYFINFVFGGFLFFVSFFPPALRYISNKLFHSGWKNWAIISLLLATYFAIISKLTSLEKVMETWTENALPYILLLTVSISLTFFIIELSTKVKTTWIKSVIGLFAFITFFLVGLNLMGASLESEVVTLDAPILERQKLLLQHWFKSLFFNKATASIVLLMSTIVVLAMRMWWQIKIISR